MTEEFKKAYDKLITKDRLIVDIVLGALVSKNLEIQDLMEKLGELVFDKQGDEE